MESHIAYAVRTADIETLIALADMAMDSGSVLSAALEKGVVALIADYLFADAETPHGSVSFADVMGYEPSDIPPGRLFAVAAQWRAKVRDIEDAAIEDYA